MIGAEAAVAIERAALLDRLELLAHTDDLTGLINRRAWDHDVVRELARARRDDLPLASRCSTSTTSRTTTTATGTRPATGCCARRPAPGGPCCGDDDMLARYGGEEFARRPPRLRARGRAAAGRAALRDVTPAGQSCSAGLAVLGRREAAEAPRSAAPTRRSTTPSGRAATAPSSRSPFPAGTLSRKPSHSRPTRAPGAAIVGRWPRSLRQRGPRARRAAALPLLPGAIGSSGSRAGALSALLGRDRTGCRAGVPRRRDRRRVCAACLTSAPGGGWWRRSKFSRLLIVAELGARADRRRARRGGLSRAVIVPVPGAPIRSLRRGFDPAAELAVALAGCTGSTVSPCLRRRDLRRQRGRSRRRPRRRAPGHRRERPGAAGSPAGRRRGHDRRHDRCLREGAPGGRIGAGLRRRDRGGAASLRGHLTLAIVGVG